jgi:hypothetical protein
LPAHTGNLISKQCAHLPPPGRTSKLILSNSQCGGKTSYNAALQDSWTKTNSAHKGTQLLHVREAGLRVTLGDHDFQTTSFLAFQDTHDHVQLPQVQSPRGQVLLREVLVQCFLQHPGGGCRGNYVTGWRQGPLKNQAYLAPGGIFFRRLQLTLQRPRGGHPIK